MMVSYPDKTLSECPVIKMNFDGEAFIIQGFYLNLQSFLKKGGPERAESEPF